MELGHKIKFAAGFIQWKHCKDMASFTRNTTIVMIAFLTFYYFMQVNLWMVYTVHQTFDLTFTKTVTLTTTNPVTLNRRSADFF